MSKIIVEIDEKLKRDFMYRCLDDDRSQKDIITELLEDFLYNKETRKYEKNLQKKVR